MVRVTNNMMVNTLLWNLNNNAGRLSKYQEQLSSETRINKLSDDPLGVITSLRSRNSRDNLEMYQKNLDSADAWMVAGETALMEINTLVMTMYEDAIHLSTDVKTGYDRQLAANKVREFRDELVQALNSSLADKYLFGGYNSVNQPFEVKNGKLYYNTFRMDAYETSELNFEHFETGMADAMQKLAQELNPPTNKQVTVSIMEKTQGYIEQMLQAADQAYKQRGCTTADIVGAMKIMRNYIQVQLDADTSATNIYNDAILNAVDAVMSLAQFEGADEAALEQTNAKLLMDNLGRLSGVMTEMVGLADAVEDGSSWTVGDALLPRVAEYRKQSDLAVQYPGLLAKEGEKKFEIVVGYGLTMDVCMNGVDIVGTGPNNLYNILDNMYDALIREFIDFSLDDDYITSDAMESLEKYVSAIANSGGLVTNNQAVVDATLETLQNMLQAGIDASAVETRYTVRDSSNNTLIDLQGGVALGGGYSFNFLDKTIRDSNGQVVVDKDGVIKVTDGSLYYLGGPGTDIMINGSNALLRQASDGSVYLSDGITQVIDGTGNLIDGGIPVVDIDGEVLDPAYTKTVTNLAMSTGFIEQAIAAAANPNWLAGSLEKEMYDEVMRLIQGYTAGGATVDELVRALTTMKDAVGALAIEAAAATTNTDLAKAGTDAVINVRVAKYLNNTTLPTDENGDPIGYRTEGSRAEEIMPFIPLLQQAQRDNLALIAIYGGRVNRCEVLTSRYEIDNINYTQRISNVEDIDTAETIMYYKMAESVYNAALSAGAKVIQQSLMDFLR